MLLPPKNFFFSYLSNEERLGKDNTDMHKKVWKKFNIKNAGEHQDHYSITEFYLLSGVVKNLILIL